MNAIVNESRVPARVTPHTTHKFKWLLWREFWEHRGGFLVAPLVASAIFLLFTAVGGGFGQAAFNRFRENPANVASINGREVPLGSVDFNQIVNHASPADMHEWSKAVSGFTLVSGVWPLMVLGVVVFFYLLGALYDERKDRSVLFWKSLPVSDTQTVLAKVATGLVVAPLIAVTISLGLMLATGVLASVFSLINGANPWTLYWSQLNVPRILFATVAWLPMYVLWALPTAGWLLLCSAWAKSKPFLWAILLPLGAGAMVGWFEALSQFKGISEWFFGNIVVRILGGTVPGSHIFEYVGSHQLNRQMKELGGTPSALLGMDDIISGWHLLATPGLWIGALAGIVMIVLAIRLRRWRDEG